MTNPIFIFVATFVGIYINMWFLLLILKNKSELFGRRIAKRSPKVSILIPAHNEEHSIEQTLNSVSTLDYPKDKLETIVIDNGSTDNTSKVVSKFKNVKLIKQAFPGKPEALNKGIKYSNGEIIGILDADTLVTKSCLKKMVGYFDDPKVGAVTTVIRVDSKKSLLEKFQNIEYLFSAVGKKLMSILNSMWVFPGTLSLTRRDLAKQIGFSNDTITEDMDFALSVHKRGFKIINCLDAVTYTQIPRTLRKLTRQRLRWYRGFIENTIKHVDILFNKKFLHLGCFIIPISYIGIFIGIILSTIFFKELSQSIILFTKTISYVPFADYTSLILSDVPASVERLLTSYYFILFILVFSTSFIVLNIAFKILRVTDKKTILLLPIYMLGYYFLIIIYWILASIMEIFGWRKKW